MRVTSSPAMVGDLLPPEQGEGSIARTSEHLFQLCNWKWHCCDALGISQVPLLFFFCFFYHRNSEKPLEHCHFWVTRSDDVASDAAMSPCHAPKSSQGRTVDSMRLPEKYGLSAAVLESHSDLRRGLLGGLFLQEKVPLFMSTDATWVCIGAAVYFFVLGQGSEIWL